MPAHNYFNPARRIQELGQDIKTYNFEEAMDQLRDGDIAIGLFERPSFDNAVVLMDKEEWDTFFDQVKTGAIKLKSIYRIDAKVAKEFLDWPAKGYKKSSKKEIDPEEDDE